MIHGSGDRYVPPANARALADAIPGAKLRVLEDAGHLVFIERFADVNREVVRFLGSRDDRPPRRTGGLPAQEGTRGPVGWLRGVTNAARVWISRAKARMGVS